MIFKNNLLPKTLEEYDKLYKQSVDNSEVFWMAGIWERWMSNDGSELDTCSVLTTKANEFMKSIHKRMPVIIPKGKENEWMENKDSFGLKALDKLLYSCKSEGWIAEPMNTSLRECFQMQLF